MSFLQIGAVQLQLDARTFNKVVREELSKKVSSVTSKPQLRMDVAQVFLDMVEKYVPMKTGKLRSQGHVVSGGHSGGDVRLVWHATHKGFDYATQQFYTQYQHYTTAGTGPNWTGQLIKNDWDQFIAAVRPLIREAFKEELNE